MLTACWSVKGGSGTTVVAAALAVLAARSRSEGAVLADLAGEAAAVLGLPEPTGPGLGDWLCAEPRPADALARLVVQADRGLGLLPRGVGPPCGPDSLGLELAEGLRGLGRPVVVDAGIAAGGLVAELIEQADTSLLVLRACYLALRRASTSGLRPTGLVVVREQGRALGSQDVEAVLGVPVIAEVDVDPAVARAVDAGLLASRLPRPLERSLRRAA